VLGHVRLLIPVFSSRHRHLVTWGDTCGVRSVGEQMHPARAFDGCEPVGRLRRRRALRRGGVPARVDAQPRRGGGVRRAAHGGHGDHRAARRRRRRVDPAPGRARTRRASSPTASPSPSTTCSWWATRSAMRDHDARRGSCAAGLRERLISRSRRCPAAPRPACAPARPCRPCRVPVRAAGVEARARDVQVRPREAVRHELAQERARHQHAAPALARDVGQIGHAGVQSARMCSGSGIAQPSSPHSRASAATRSRNASSPMIPIVRMPSATIWAR
jgi:hypothetical protein